VDKDCKLEILYLDSVDSTHTYLKQYINKYGYKHPLAVFSNCQLNGIGSRDNSWDGAKGNFYLSFVIDRLYLPSDIPLQSLSIYFSYILKDILTQCDSKVWLKWPNDFYIDNKKIGGTITNIIQDKIYCGIGINLLFIDNQYGYLDIAINPKDILEKYFARLSKKILWKHIFSKYLIEFELSKSYSATIDGKKISLADSVLNNDGSLIINNKKVFSLR